MQNRTSLLLGAFVLLTGFLMICLGAFFISSGSILSCWGSQILAYLLLPLGFAILLSGIFWSTYRQANGSKGVFSRVLGEHLAQGALPLATVDRPDFYPPAYEESPDAEKPSCPAQGEAWHDPPPRYTETSLEFQDENDAQPEAPPAYEEDEQAWQLLQCPRTPRGHAGSSACSEALRHPAHTPAGVRCSEDRRRAPAEEPPRLGTCLGAPCVTATQAAAGTEQAFPGFPFFPTQASLGAPRVC